MTKVSSNKGAKKLAKLLFLILGLALFINGIISTHFSGMGLGVILTYIFALVLILNFISIQFMNKRFVTFVCHLILFIFVLMLVYSGFVYSYGKDDTVTYKEDAVIVLGTTVLGDQPCADLEKRLEATIEYNKKNPDALIIVTGGQGTDENKSEAYVMNKYLSNAGINKSQIIMEDKATSTVENFKYSIEILNSEIGSDPKVAYISNDFHIFRAGILANEAGINDATHYHGNTPWYMIIPNGLRESVVTIKMWLID